MMSPGSRPLIPGSFLKIMFNQAFPGRPGVYWFLQGRKVIYVGKAKNLSRRLKSYPRQAGFDPKTKLLLAAADHLRWQGLDSEIEAILTEARLIKLYQPHFNLILKDDKTPVYLTITKAVYPRILITRQTGTFGPFSSTRTLRQILERLRHIFPYCDQPAGSRPCFYYHLGLCPGACIGVISRETYAKNITDIQLFFQNKKKRLVASLKKEMLNFAKAQKYEPAQAVQKQLEALSYFWQARVMSLELPRLSQDQIQLELNQLFGFRVNRIETYDSSNLSGTNPTGAMVVATHGRPDKAQYRLFNIRSLATPNDPAMMAEMISRRLKHSEWAKPDLIIVDGGRTQIKAVKKLIPADIMVVGLAKKPDRLVGVNKPLDLNTAAARLLIQLRDEAHRFGRRQHLRLRSKTLFI